MIGTIFIAGMYKSGTSWLLHVLSAHPEIVGLREVDIIKACYGGNALYGPFEPDGLDPRRMLANIFGRSAWCHVAGSNLDAVDRAIESGDIDLIVDRLTALALEKDDHCARTAMRLPASTQATPTTFWQLPVPLLRDLVARLLACRNPRAFADSFLGVHDHLFEEPYRLALKGADQVAVFDQLRADFPASPKIVIVRDGRDAAISAQHYRRLAGASDFAWAGRPMDLSGYLKSWATSARKVHDLAERGELQILRYEDLTLDFANHCAALLRRLGVDASPAVVETIEGLSSFEAQTGRKRGQEARDIRRKGAIREWLDIYDKDARDDA